MTDVVMLGAGFIGQMHAFALRLSSMALREPDVHPRLRCLIETEEGLAGAGRTAERFGWEETRTEGWEEVLKSTACDLFVNAGPNEAHVAPCIGFAHAKRHVFCEKPLAATSDAALDAWQAVEKAGVKHMCAFVHRFIPAIQQARAIIRSGDLGEIINYRSQFLLDMRTPDNALSWRFSRAKAGGGATGDLGSHHIDAARFLVGEIEEVSALARTTSTDPTGTFGDINDDSFVAVARLAGGALATFDASRVSGGHALTGRIEVDGTRGTLAFDMERFNELRIATDRGGARTFLVTAPGHPYADFFLPVGIQGAHPNGWRDCFTYQMHHMLRAIEHGQEIAPLGATFEDGYRVAEIVDTILHAAATRVLEPVRFRSC